MPLLLLLWLLLLGLALQLHQLCLGQGLLPLSLPLQLHQLWLQLDQVVHQLLLSLLLLLLLLE